MPGLELTFTDGRLPFERDRYVRAGDHAGLLPGYPVTGTATVTIPPLHPAVGLDAGPDGDGDASGSGDASSSD